MLLYLSREHQHPLTGGLEVKGSRHHCFGVWGLGTVVPGCLICAFDNSANLDSFPSTSLSPG